MGVKVRRVTQYGWLAVNPDDAAITAAIISMAKSLRLKVIAEGVENEAQMSFLRAHQCDEIQGYYFSKALAPEQPPTSCEAQCMPCLQAKARDRALRNKLPGASTSPIYGEEFIMAIGLVLLLSADPAPIHLFCHALQQLSLSPDVCQEAPAATRPLNLQEFDAVIVDLQLGETNLLNSGWSRMRARRTQPLAGKRPAGEMGTCQC